MILELAGDRQLISVEKWANVLRQEYLSDYVPSGGSAMKVISGNEETLRNAQARVGDMARSGNFFYAELDPLQLDEADKRPDLHRIDKFFFAVTRNVDWKSWAAEQARRYLERRGIFLREGRALGDVDGIAADNNRQPEDLLNQYQSEFATPQIKDVGLAVEFRAAITALGRAQLIPDAVTPTTEEVLLAWFAGRTMPGAAHALKKVQVFERIHQNNARHIFASFAHWLPQAGYSGLVLVLDFRPYEYKKLTKAQKQAEQMRRIREAIARGASHDELAGLAEEISEPTVSYSDTAYMQMLNMIRRFIDEIDWFERTLLVILTTPRFYDMESRRNYYNYDALQTRIGLEVHDARRANPSAALVHLSADSPVSLPPLFAGREEA
jgi:hypothetical protein